MIAATRSVVAIAVKSCANSDVSPLESVAVAETASPAGISRGTLTRKLALPEESVVTVVVASKVSPWPYPEGSAVGLAKN